MQSRAILLTAVTILSVVAAGTSGAAGVADAPGEAHVDTPAFAPDEAVNDSTDGYRGVEPTRNWTDVPVDLDTAPEGFDSADGASPAAVESDSIVMDPDDEDHPLVGTSKQYLGRDVQAGSYYFKEFTLLSVGENIEVWVANDLAWPADDPREDPTITEAQAEAMASQFDENMYGPETEAFGEPAPRDGGDALLSEQGVVPEDYYETGEGSNRTVLLVDNVRDENYYDPTYPLYVAGFYSPTIQEYTDRNAITVNAAYWNEVNESNQRTGYEGTLAHEYQHLVHNDLDGDETTWINEGLSDYAEVITGYGVPEGHLSAYEEMPSNSLVNWEDQGAINVLADYGVAFAFAMYLDDQYGQAFVSDLAADDANGIESVENTLDEFGAQRDFYELYQDFSTAAVTDDVPTPAKDEFHIDGLDVELNTSGDVGTTGVWGTNYEEVDTGGKGPITGVSVSGTEFTDTEWSTATDPVTGEGEVLSSGAGNLLDRHAIVETDLTGVEDPTLTFDSYQRIEANWDYGFVQVSTDGGDTWRSLANEHTDDTPNPDAHPTVKANVPGLTGDTDGWQSQSFDLSAYAGNESVLVSFRYVTDWAFVKDGWWVRNVSVAGESVPTDTADPFLSEREATGDDIEYQFTFVGLKQNGNYQVKQLDMRTFDESGQQELEQFLHNPNFETVVVASTWAAPQGDSGRVPVGVEFQFQFGGDHPGQGPPDDGDDEDDPPGNGPPGNGGGPPGHGGGPPGNGPP